MIPRPVRLRFLTNGKVIGHFYLRAVDPVPTWRLSCWDPLLNQHNSYDGVGYDTAMALLVPQLEGYAQDMWARQQDQRRRFIAHWKAQGRPERIVNPGMRAMTAEQLFGRLLAEHRNANNEYVRLCCKAMADATDWNGSKVVKLPWQTDNGITKLG